jgi:hypothetical protein
MNILFEAEVYFREQQDALPPGVEGAGPRIDKGPFVVCLSPYIDTSHRRKITTVNPVLITAHRALC